MIPLIRIFAFLVRLLPVRLAGAIGAGLGRFYYLIGSRHRRIALHNLARVYPDSDPAWRIRIAHESFAELGRTAFELPHVYLRSEDFLRSRIRFDGADTVNEALAEGNGAILTGCHYANWEVGAMSFSLFVPACEMIHRPLRNDAMEALLKGWRERFGNRLHARNESIRWIPRSLKQSKTLAIVIDQHLSGGVPVPFLGHEGRTTVVPATYALQRNTPVFAGLLRRHGRQFRFTVEIKRVEFPEASGNTEADTLRYSTVLNDAFAEMIHERPECWLWLHRRWLYLDEQEQAA